MSTMMEEEIKHWTARRKSALIMAILQDKTTDVSISTAVGMVRHAPSKLLLPPCERGSKGQARARGAGEGAH